MDINIQNILHTQSSLSKRDEYLMHTYKRKAVDKDRVSRNSLLSLPKYCLNSRPNDVFSIKPVGEITLCNQT